MVRSGSCSNSCGGGYGGVIVAVVVVLCIGRLWGSVVVAVVNRA